MNSILTAGLNAPSPKNRQPWEFVVITNREEKTRFSNRMRAEILELHNQKPDREDIVRALETLTPIEQCSVLILVCYKNNTTVIHDDCVDWNMSAKDVEALELMALGASVENMLLEAQALGVASLWCGDVLYAYRFLKSFSDFPVVSAVCFGYTDHTVEKPLRKELKAVFKLIK